ncbi:MAG: histidine kinase dimerization/phospho-acceptor domain-containing protein, partial [Bacteroidota bacterium]
MKSIGLQILLSVCLCTSLLAGNDPPQVAGFDSLFAKVQTMRANSPDSAIRLLQLGYENYVAASDTLAAIQTLIQWAHIAGHLGNYRASYDKLWKALILADEAKIEKEKAYVYLELGRYYSFFKRKDEAFHYLDLSLAITREQVAQGRLSSAKLVKHYYSLCTTHRELNSPESAQRYLDSCWLFFDPQVSEVELPKLKLEQAYLLKETRKYAAALKLFHEIKPWFEEHRPANQVLLLTFMGDTYRLQQNYTESEEYYLAALAISRRYHSHLDFIPLVHEKLAHLYADMGKHSLAYQSLTVAKELDRQIFDSRSEKNHPLLKILDDFRVEQENREKLLKEQQLAQLMHEDEVLFLQRTILFISLILLLIIGLVYFKQVRSKHQAEKKAFERSQEIDQVRLQLFTDVSHELKTPLTLILGPLRQLLALDHVDEKVRESLAMMERNTRQLTRLIHEILEFRKVESGKAKLNLALGDLVAFTLELIGPFKLMAETKQVSLIFEAQPKEM